MARGGRRYVHTPFWDQRLNRFDCACCASILLHVVATLYYNNRDFTGGQPGEAGTPRPPSRWRSTNCRWEQTTLGLHWAVYARCMCMCAVRTRIYADPLYAADMVRFEVALVCINGLLLATGVGLFSIVRRFSFFALAGVPVSLVLALRLIAALATHGIARPLLRAVVEYVWGAPTLSASSYPLSPLTPRFHWLPH